MSLQKLFTQSPNEILDRTATLVVVDADTLASATWVATPAGLTLTPQSVSGVNAKVRVSSVGATLGRYTLTVHALGLSGQEYEQSVIIVVAAKVLIRIFYLDPSELLDFEERLLVDAADADTISAAAWSIAPATGPVVTVSTFTVSTATARIDGNGAAAGLYVATVLMTGTSGQKYEQGIRIRVQEL